MIKYVVMDVDGTLTDGKIYIGSSGEIMKAFSAKDGFGIHDLLIPNGLIPIVITGRESAIVKRRCEELGIGSLFQNVGDKKHKLIDIVTELDHVAYIGDDMNDFPAMKAVKEAGGIIGCPFDACPTVKEFADFVSTHVGGDGAVRDFIEWILASVEENGL